MTTSGEFKFILLDFGTNFRMQKFVQRIFSSLNVTLTFPAPGHFLMTTFECKGVIPKIKFTLKGHCFLWVSSADPVPEKPHNGPICQCVCFQGHHSCSSSLCALNRRGGPGLEWWLGRPAFSLVIHEEKVEHGPRVVRGYIPDQAETGLSVIMLRPTQLSSIIEFLIRPPRSVYCFNRSYKIASLVSPVSSQRYREMRIILESEGLCKPAFARAIAEMVYQQEMRSFHFGFECSSFLPGCLCVCVWSFPC